MSSLPPDEANPFLAPTAGIGDRALDLNFAGDIGDAELIRRAHIGHEASVRSLGILNYLGAFFGAIGTVFLFLMVAGVIPMNQPNANPNALPPEMLRWVFLGFGVFYLLITVLYGFLGYGLRALQQWARWTTVALTSLGLAYALIVSLVAFVANPIAGVFALALGSLIPGYILYLMASAKAGVIFSAEYKAIIRKTPHVKYKTSLIVKIFLALLLAVIGLLVVMAIYSAFTR